MRRALIAIFALCSVSCGNSRDETDAPPASTKKTGVPASPIVSAPSDEEANPREPANACLTQDGVRLHVPPRRAVGTEPFWGAGIEGRCVRYSHPEDPNGTRIWTRYIERPDGGIWTGSLHGRLFELRLHSEPGCSDGMSDKRYPFATALKVDGESRKGCAEPL